MLVSPQDPRLGPGAEKARGITPYWRLSPLALPFPSHGIPGSKLPLPTVLGPGESGPSSRCFLRQRGISAKLLHVEFRIHPPVFPILRSLASHKHIEYAALWTEPGTPLMSGSSEPLFTRSAVTWVEPKLPLGKSHFLSSLFCKEGVRGKEP